MNQNTPAAFRLILQPGLWRDYSTFSAPGCTDAAWFRFYHTRLRKIGGYKFVGGLNFYTAIENYQNQLQNTQPSYPGKQYSNQDLTKPWDSNFNDANGDPYESYDFITSGQDATFLQLQGISDVGYRIPRKILNVVLDGINQLIVTADYNQPKVNTDENAGGIAFGQSLSNTTHVDFANGRFPQLNASGDRNSFGYTPNTTYVWSLEYVNLTTGNESAQTSTYIIAHPSCATSAGIADPTNRYAFIIAADNLVDEALLSPISSETPVTDLVPPYATEVSVSGGVCVVGPFVFAYGNNGLIRNSDVNNPLKWANPGAEEWQFAPGLANDVNVCNSKIVKGISVRGYGTYSALFWSLDSVILATFVGAPAVFSYTVIANNVSIMSPNCVVENASQYYWIGDGRFFKFVGGGVQEIQNDQNRAWFFENVNPSYQHLTYGFINPRFTEVWWVFPFGTSTECNWALIYNYETNCWYDTPMERSAGTYSSVFGRPLMASPNLNTEGKYSIYLHDYGMNGVEEDGLSTPIPAFFVTPDIGNLSNPTNGAPKIDGGLLQNWTELIRVEPDANITGPWKLEVEMRRFANSPVIMSPFYTFDDTTTKIDLREQSRIMQLRISSCSDNTSFYLGNFMLTSIPGDAEGI